MTPAIRLPPRRALQQKWYRREVKFPEVTQVPGCWHYKTGKPCDMYGSVVWFKKAFKIPAEWNKGRVWINIGGVKPSADIWFNDIHLGFTVSLPHADQNGRHRSGQARARRTRWRSA